MDAAVANGPAAPVDLLRLGVFDVDPQMSKVARQGLAQSTSEGAVDVIGEALRVPMETPEKDALIAALARLGESSPRARTLAVVHQGLGSRSDAVDADRWSRELASADSAVRARSARSLSPLAREAAEAGEKARIEARLADREKALAIGRSREAPRSRRGVDRARARDRRRDGRREGRAQGRTRRRDEGREGGDVRMASERRGAVAAYYLGTMDEAYARAEVAVREVAADPDSWNAMVVVALFGEMRQKAIVKAIEEKKHWPKQWLTDVHAAYAVLARHPDGDDNHVAVHYDFLKWLGGTGQAVRVLDDGLARFPDSDYLHGRLRNRIMQERGVEGLEPEYERRLKEPGAHKSLEWFAGLATIRAAEYHRRMRHSGRGGRALRPRRRHFEKAAAGGSR